MKRSNKANTPAGTSLREFFSLRSDLIPIVAGEKFGYVFCHRLPAAGLADLFMIPVEDGRFIGDSFRGKTIAVKVTAAVFGEEKKALDPVTVLLHGEIFFKERKVGFPVLLGIFYDVGGG